MSLKLQDYAELPSGLFVLNVFRKGELVERFEERNLIVDNSKQIHARLLGGDVTNRSVTQIAYGTNGTAPAAGNTTIAGAYSKMLDGTTYPATNQVQFAFSLGSGEANGMSIIEFGLLTAGATLYARKVRTGAIYKDTDVSFSGTWTINF